MSQLKPIDTPALVIPESQYSLGEEVWLLFHGSAIPTSIKVRHFDPDKFEWYYRVAMSGQWHTAEDLCMRPVPDRDCPF